MMARNEAVIGLNQKKTSMLTLTGPERQLLERLADEGKATKLFAEDLQIAKSLEGAGLVFLVRDGLGRGGGCAVIMPKGRHLLAELERKPPKPPKPPFGFHE